MVLLHKRKESSDYRSSEDELKYLDHFHNDDPHDDCAHWFGVHRNENRVHSIHI